MSGEPPQSRAAGAERAVALRHDASADGAPRVTASGAGFAARRILELADEHDIPIHRDADLAGLLALCDVGAEVPEALWGAVAEVLVWLHRANELTR